MLDFEKKKQLGILVKIAMVDEHFDDYEKAVIKRISKKYGATDQELDDIFQSPPVNESLAPMSVTEKMDFMMDCMLVVLADNVVTISERYFARHMASRLGFDKEVVPFLIEHKDTDREKMKELMLPFIKTPD